MARYWLLSLLLLVSACDTSKIPGLWKTFEHPTYRYQLRYPRSWNLKRNPHGSMVALVAKKEDRVYPPNLNIVAQLRGGDRSLEQLADKSAMHLKVILNNYRVLSRAPGRWGGLDSLEIRGLYEGPEGKRIIRTILARTKLIQYVVTLGVREIHEEAYQKTFQRILNSFEVPPDLRAK